MSNDVNAKKKNEGPTRGPGNMAAAHGKIRLDKNSVKLLNHFEIKTKMTSYHEYNK